MAYEMKDNSGSLFKNDKRTTENHPHRKGRCMVGGVKYWVSAWSKPGSNGKQDYVSLSFTPCEKQQPRQPPATQQEDPAPPFTEDDCPF